MRTGASVPGLGPALVVLAGMGAGIGVLATLAAAPAGAVAEGPVPGYTGGFGEPTCTTCHFDSPAEPEAGELLLLGVPAVYEPAVTYPIVVTLRDPGLERAGFQLAVRWADGPREGRQAGRLAAGGPGTEVVEDGEPPVLYARQTLDGSRPAKPGEAAWTVAWTAPEASEEKAAPVVFHAAGNAADDDDSELGDVIHTRTARSEPCRERQGAADGRSSAGEP